MRPRFVTPTVVFTLCLAFSQAAPAQEARAPVDRVMEAYGGMARLAEIPAYRVEGRIRAHPREEDGHFVRVLEGPARLKVSLRYPSGSEVRILQDRRGWRGSAPDRLTAVDGPLLHAMRLQSARAALPWMIFAMRDMLTVTKEGPHGTVLEGPLDAGLVLRFFVQRPSYRVVRSEGEIHLGERTISLAVILVRLAACGPGPPFGGRTATALHRIRASDCDPDRSGQHHSDRRGCPEGREKGPAHVTRTP